VFTMLGINCKGFTFPAWDELSCYDVKLCLG
jgi:hypothetical protein